MMEDSNEIHDEPTTTMEVGGENTVAIVNVIDVDALHVSDDHDDDDDDDVETGTHLPVIELPYSSITASSRDSSSSLPRGLVDGDIEAAVVVEPPSNGAGISPLDLERSPIARLVEEHIVVPAAFTTTLRESLDPQCVDGAVTTPLAGCCAVNSYEDDSIISSTSSMTQQEPSVMERRAEFISATVIKESEETPMGMELTSKDDSAVVISAITPETLMANTPFRVGDRVLSVNTKRCYSMDAKDLVQFMSKLVGTVTVVIHNATGDPNFVESMITKPSPDARCGLGLVSSGRQLLKISSVNSDGLFYDSLLNVGDPIVSINGEECQFCDAQDAGEIIGRAERYVTVKARTLLETGVVVAAFSCTNNSTGTSAIPPQILSVLERTPKDKQPLGLLVTLVSLIAVGLICLLLVTKLFK